MSQYVGMKVSLSSGIKGEIVKMRNGGLFFRIGNYDVVITQRKGKTPVFLRQQYGDLKKGDIITISGRLLCPVYSHYRGFKVEKISCYDAKLETGARVSLWSLIDYVDRALSERPYGFYIEFNRTGNSATLAEFLR